MGRTLKTLSSKITSRISAKVENLGTAAQYAKTPIESLLFREMGFDPKENILSCDQDFIDNYFSDIWQNNQTKSSTTSLMKSSLSTRLLGDYLVKVDRTSMANSLEVRSPFLDHHLAELAFSIPNTLKFKEKLQKYLLKKLGEKHMYPDIFEKKKRGFSMPLAEWIKLELYEFCGDQLADLAKRKELIEIDLNLLLERHKKGIADESAKIWSFVCLETWLKKNFD